MCKPSLLFVIVVQLPSCIPLLATPWTESHQASLSTVSWSFLKFMSTESVMLSNHLILCCPLQSFPASGSFPVSWLFTSGGQIIGASASVLPMSIQGLFPLRLTGLISLLSKGLSRDSPAPQFESISSLAVSFLYGSTLTSVHDYWKKP